MGWFDGWFGGSDNSSSDPLRRLDPKLREFLERESPVKYNAPPTSKTAAAPPQQAQQQPPDQAAQPPTTTATTTATTNATTNASDSAVEQQQPRVPPQSLFPDGRYAHLWKTYRPLAEIEAETKSDNEKLTDVIEAFKERRGLIGRAALENCAEEQVEWSQCMKSGSWRARMTMCRDEVHKFERCYNAQSRLLKALGYLSVQGRSPEVDEDIQMRADELYHRMLDQEREAEKARAEGREVPAFKPLFDDDDNNNNNNNNNNGGAGRGNTAAAGAPSSEAAKVPEPSAATLASWKEKLEKLPPEEREAEEKALRAEHRAKAEMAMQIQKLWEEQAKEREARKAEGKETIMDKFASLAASWRGPKSS
ncbi:uncharacterized protein P884DRAFT_255639 [Thermothelomyces heterothallicus CBS 202.75]|uniref:uncharacterized protein n=1 Tax=Thermothelomyces heterothallicus CBS 202.75 TaxID=1149848 RepID=UPI0037437A15